MVRSAQAEDGGPRLRSRRWAVRLVLVLAGAMFVGGLGLAGFGAHAAAADRSRQHRLEGAVACRVGDSREEARDADCVAVTVRQVRYISVEKDTSVLGFDDGSPLLHFDRAADWVLRLREGESVSVLSWRGEDEALRSPGPGHTTVYAQSSPVVSEDNNAAAALLGVMFTCCGGAIAIRGARAAFSRSRSRAARFYRAHPRLHDFAVAELTVIACTAMVSALLVGQGDVSAGILTPAIAIPAATLVALVVLRTVLRRDLLKSPRRAAGGPLAAGLPPDLE